ncbi:hypothetical protein [Streptomyces sp. WMMC940]|uniref:hypothetical protein n=1 Tax=Streptomyces sp. WMMC940 TaxID=3015153 RepID=UPI0022B6B35E|nr:hypothetical protein [Streptomyces sp. WMMC940]MCZ7462329.1 hypothetical protein [Streptomyces sp. WMMC940]
MHTTLQKCAYGRAVTPQGSRWSCAAVPHTINAIGIALVGERGARCYGEVLAAEEKNVTGAVRRWWAQAMLDRARGTERSRANDAEGAADLAVLLGILITAAERRPSHGRQP